MYEAHFGLRARPFGETVHPGRYVALESREAVLRRLRYGLEHGQGPALLFGPPGTGKTLLAATLARSLPGACLHVAFPAMPASELVAFLADELASALPHTSAPKATNGNGSAKAANGHANGATNGATNGAAGVHTNGAYATATSSHHGFGSLTRALQRIRALLAGTALRGERPLLVVDEAHLIDDTGTFETLRLLLNFATSGPPDLGLLLVGSAEILLRLPAGLADRLTARCLLGPLEEKESAAYVTGRLTAAGAREPLFDEEALSALHAAADGLPRRLSRLADLALLIAYASSHPRPLAADVAIAAAEAQFDYQAS